MALIQPFLRLLFVVLLSILSSTAAVPPLTFLAATEDPHSIERASRFGLGLVFDSDSLRDRTEDVLSVVMALLFGVCCGALTAATMYLCWSLICNLHRYSDLDYDDFEDDDADMSPKKAGYVKNPPPPPADASPLGDVKILPSPPGDASSAGDVKIPLCPAYAPPGGPAPAGDVKIPPSPAHARTSAGDVKIPLSPADASPAGHVKIPRPALAYEPICPKYNPSSPGYSVFRPRADLSPLISYAPSYYYELIPPCPADALSPVANGAVQESDKISVLMSSLLTTCYSII